ncbi:nucleotide-binding protein [Ramlibacter sp.]|uniref:OB-fold nucleic acid binding domain-containing protein n=1 Tax=Ramlibacter sp. TaxID=1917967 RepID=UPI002BDF82F5|nr:nucleotide-binding protein [Ramlibacter sp.]HWI83406.1 nucleotide-binding protein [Ramlibacter sp.]
MKKLMVACLLAAAPFAWSADVKPAAGAAPFAVTGEVLEVQNVEMYTYLRLRTAQGETWAAVPTAKVNKGARVTVENAMVMNNFQSKALKKTFDTVVFGTLGNGKSAAAPGAVAQGPAGPHAMPPKAAEPDAKVPKATGPNARTVAEIAARPADLKDKPVLVRGKVVKFNGGIMGKNWIHLRDGSGSAKDNTNDVLVTTKDQVQVGDIVTAKGVVRVDKDFGSGYTYKVLVEEATLQK